MPPTNIAARIRFFLHPLPLGAVLLMAANDHWLKYLFPGFLTGKISDFCGVFYFPIFLLALAATIDEGFRLQRFRLNKFTVLVAILVTDLLMILVKLSPEGARLIENFFAASLFKIQLIQDPSDLVAFILNPLTYQYLRSYWTASKET